jgi:pimeloyl-ACP methyl ester carboxylesterase/DNA-binding CsgD family transcriptional regulator
MAIEQRFHPVFQKLIDQPELSLQALRDDPEGFEAQLIADEGGALNADTAIPAIEALGIMVFDGVGGRVPHDSPDWLPPFLDFASLSRTARELRPGSRLLHVNRGDASGLYAIWAFNTDTRRWNLPARVRELATSHPQGRIVLVAGGAADEGAIRTACRSFGLTALESRAAIAVIRAGSGRRAAAYSGLAYTTIREALSSASARLGAPNLPALVQTLIAAAFGVLPGDGDPATTLTDMLPLNARQAKLAALIGEGLTRDEAADALRVSGAVAKKELETIYATLGVGTASELARLVTEVRALRLLARSTDGAPGYSAAAAEPTRHTPRGRGNEIIAWSDYGPSSGRPVLVVHSNWQCRAVPRPLLDQLHANGFRPIAIDRPGFGGTELGGSTPIDPFSQAIEDTLRILDGLGIERIPIVARCGAQFVAALKRAAPERVGPVVLVSPTPQTGDSGLRRNVVGVIKEAFYRSPRMIEFFFRVICAQVSLQRVEALTRAIVAGSPADEALCDDPSFIRDRLRAIRPFSAGNMAGAIHEERIISQGGFDFGMVDARDWLIFQGDQDPHNNLVEVEEYWKSLAPAARLTRVADGGRFMTSSHPEIVVAAIKSLMK